MGEHRRRRRPGARAGDPRAGEPRAEGLPASGPRVGLLGLFGQGNLGNDGSLEAMLAYLRDRHPDAVLDVRCSAPGLVSARYGVAADRLRWYRPEEHPATGPVSRARKALGVGLGLGIDAIRTARWVRRHDVVIVPGMGVLEATLPLRPWHLPYLMYLLGRSGRRSGTKVALVSVGSNVIHQRITRMLVTSGAREAYYRSFRDDRARDAMAEMGVDTTRDPVYPDLAFSLPIPAEVPRVPGAVGVGVMEYSGSNDDRRRAAEIRAAYLAGMTQFVLWLVDQGRPVRLLAGDTIDQGVVDGVVADVREQRPGLGPAALVAEPAHTLGELMGQLDTVDTVVATRYHTVLCALVMAKPTVAVGYGAKFDALMAAMELTEFSQSARALDAGRLIGQFTELERRAPELSATVARQAAASTALLDRQFTELSALLFRAEPPAPESPALKESTR
jgi:polysaccharide pyruvyl transferase WcaK-like protein